MKEHQFNPKRERFDDCYWMINEDKIKEYILKLSRLLPEECERELIRTDVPCQYGATGAVLYALNGSPPRGYAIYQKDYQRLIVINMDLDVKRTYSAVFIDVLREEGRKK